MLYFGLFFVFCYFYMIDQLNDFIKGRSTITSRFEKAPFLEPPTVTICLTIPLKPSVSLEYNFTSQYDIFFKEEPNITLPKRFENLGYLLNRDFQIKIITKTWKRVYLQEGLNDFEGYKYEVMNLKTAFNGMCYKIQPLFEMKSVPYKVAALKMPIYNILSTLFRLFTAHTFLSARFSERKLLLR